MGAEEMPPREFNFKSIKAIFDRLLIIFNSLDHVPTQTLGH